MRTNSFLAGVVASVVALAVAGGCKKKEEDTAASAAPAAAPPPAAPAPEAAPAAVATDAPAADTAAAPPAGGEDLGDIKRYPGETPLSGTVKVKVPFNAYQEADLNSEKEGTIPAGTFIDLVATYSNWMLVKFPVGVGELGPGWIQLPNIYDSRVAKEEPPPDRKALKVRKKPRKERKDEGDKKVVKKKEK
jgi:hypothetical protein